MLKSSGKPQRPVFGVNKGGFAKSWRGRLIAFFSLLVFSVGGADDRPNILLMICDDLRADALGCMGHPWVETPHIDRLAFDGVIFDRAYTVSAISGTSRASILTGQYPARSKWRHGDLLRAPLSDAQMRQTFLSHLKLGGYRIGYIGKWDVGSKPPEAFFDDGFAFEGDGRYYDQPGQPHLTQLLSDQAISVIKQVDNRPFFLGIGFKAPSVQENLPPYYIYDRNIVGDLYEDLDVSQSHSATPVNTDQLPDFMKRSLNREIWGKRFNHPKLANESIRGYYRLVSGVDRAVGAILEALEESGQKGNTVVIFTSDHGVFLGARGFGGNWLPHEPSIAIPLIVADQREANKNKGRRDEFALTIDLAPTILDLAGVPIPNDMQGKSLVPSLRGMVPEDWREEFFYDHYYMPFKIPSTEAVRTPRFKYIRYINSDPLFEELYDISKDPNEERNLIGDANYTFVHDMMERKWAHWRQAVQSDLK